MFCPHCSRDHIFFFHALGSHFCLLSSLVSICAKHNHLDTVVRCSCILKKLPLCSTGPSVRSCCAMCATLSRHQLSLPHHMFPCSELQSHSAKFTCQRKEPLQAYRLSLVEFRPPLAKQTSSIKTTPKTDFMMTLRSVVCVAALAATLAMSSPLVALPEQFYVTLGTTIPFEGVDPVAQTGGMYVDGVHRRFRVDTFWMESSRSIVVDFERGVCFVLHNHNCKMMRIGVERSGRTKQRSLLGVPEGFTLHPDVYNVRGAAVKRYSGVERGEYLQQVDYYVRNMTFVNPRVIPEHQDDAPLVTQVPILWRIETQRSRRRELRAPPVKDTNWRFFGQPLNELVPLDEPISSAVEQVIADVPITVDFFNFVPMQPDPNVFLMPATCEQLSEELDRDVDVFSAQRLLVDLSFHSAQGQAVMGSLWERKATPTAASTPIDDDVDL